MDEFWDSQMITSDLKSTHRPCGWLPVKSLDGAFLKTPYCKTFVKKYHKCVCVLFNSHSLSSSSTITKNGRYDAMTWQYKMQIRDKQNICTSDKRDRHTLHMSLWDNTHKKETWKRFFFDHTQRVKITTWSTLASVSKWRRKNTHCQRHQWPIKNEQQRLGRTGNCIIWSGHHRQYQETAITINNSNLTTTTKRYQSHHPQHTQWCTTTITWLLGTLLFIET